MDLKSNATLAEVLHSASVFLEKGGLDGCLARDYWLRLFDWSLTELVGQLRQVPDRQALEHYQAVLERLIRHEPLQYILGYEDFAGLRFKVGPAALIPREDTAGIVDLAEGWLTRHPQARDLLDMGTGTGILAVSLAKRFPKLQVVAADISPAALDLARENAQFHDVSISFCQSDVCDQLPAKPSFDLVVSNPPYISRDEVDLMDPSVLAYEPELALFAPNQGLAFYQALAQQLPQRMRACSCLIVEIGFAQGQAVIELFADAFKGASISLHQDLNGHDRYVMVQREEEEWANGNTNI